MEKSKNLAIIILAAGKSSRLGSITKQLLKYREKSLLKTAVEKALEISNDVYVVLGHEKENCKKEIENLNVNILFNPNYENGLGSSISFGISHTKNYKNSMILLCDQPFITTYYLKSMCEKIDNHTIISSLYENENTPSVPAIFPLQYYKKLLELNEDKGAKSLLKNEYSISLKLEKKHSIDIDTLEDVSNFLNL